MSRKNFRNSATIPTTLCSDVRGNLKLPSIGKFESYDKLESVRDSTPGNAGVVTFAIGARVGDEFLVLEKA